MISFLAQMIQVTHSLCIVHHTARPAMYEREKLQGSFRYAMVHIAGFVKLHADIVILYMT